MDDQAVLDIVRAVASELHPRPASIREVTLDRLLDRDLGFDSLSRVELVLRLEHAFDIVLPEQLLASAETPRDLCVALRRAQPSQASVHERRISVGPAAEETTPVAAQRLTEVLWWQIEKDADRTHVWLYQSARTPERISFGKLGEAAKRIAAGLQRHGLLPGQTVAMMLPTGPDYLFCFMGVLVAGGVPVPIYPPARASQIKDHLLRHTGILASARAVMLVTVAEALPLARALRSGVDTLATIVTADLLGGTSESATPLPRSSDELALLQYTSGSTGQPKGVGLTHGQLLANIRAMGEAIHASSEDVFVSWLPLYHDMGLIGAWLASLYYAMPVVLMPSLTFLAHPARWLWAIHEHRGTLSAAPNFAYELALDKIAESEIEGLDLSSWRVAFNGAEPVSVNTVQRFQQRFAAYGFGSGTMAPVYGLAEAGVGLAFPPLGRGPVTDRIQRQHFQRTGQATPAADADEQALKLVACGHALNGYEIRVIDDAGRELPERREGQLEFRGPSATQGYFHNPGANESLFDGDWLRTGDLGYIVGGDIYLTGRSKDLIIRGGRNLYPYELEATIGELSGVRKGCVAAFGSLDRSQGTERLVVVAETRETQPSVLAQIRVRVLAASAELLGTPVDEVVLVAPHAVLKTSSGKIRRAAVRELFESHRIGRPEPPRWWQVTGFYLTSLRPRWRRFGRRAGDELYAVYARLLFWVLTPLVWMLVVLLPRFNWRWWVIQRSTKALFRLAGVPIKVNGLGRLPAKPPYLLVANHASYLDGLVLAACLPEPICYVAKGELKSKWIAHLLLRRIGAEFVERTNRSKGLEDLRRTARVLGEQRVLLYFPEGTITRMPGLLPFRLGAFVVAAESAVPLVPIVIRGTRSILRSGSWFPHRGAISVTVAAPVRASGSNWSAQLALRDRTRELMLRYLDEPDLSALQIGPTQPPA